MRVRNLLPRGRRITARAGGCLVLGLLVLAGGCGGARRSAATAEVKGRVLYHDKPVTGGDVAFVTIPDGFAHNGIIDEQGNYTINAPVGQVKITVNNMMLMRGAGKHAPSQRGAGQPRPDAPKGEQRKGTWVQIPSKYSAADTSDLTYTVTKGAQTYDIILKD